MHSISLLCSFIRLQEKGDVDYTREWQMTESGCRHIHKLEAISRCLIV